MNTYSKVNETFQNESSLTKYVKFLCSDSAHFSDVENQGFLGDDIPHYAASDVPNDTLEESRPNISQEEIFTQFKTRYETILYDTTNTGYNNPVIVNAKRCSNHTSPQIYISAIYKKICN